MTVLHVEQQAPLAVTLDDQNVEPADAGGADPVDAAESALVKTGSSYLSQSELPITFGVGSGKGADDVTIEWPGGKSERLGTIPAGFEATVEEGRGIVSRRTITDGAKSPSPTAPR